MPYAAYDSLEFEDFDNAYRNWILTDMDMERYGILLDVLADTKFVWSPFLPRDADRATDGRYLRMRFSEETGMPILDEWLGEEYPCSFLEFLVALAHAIVDRISYEPGDPDQATRIFWEMLCNLGLDRFDDETMIEEGMCAYRTVSATITKAMERLYDYYGHGGVFPLTHPEMDQRDVEIWYQANAYMMEKLGW